jgi:hypothetical protein
MNPTKFMKFVELYFPEGIEKADYSKLEKLLRMCLVMEGAPAQEAITTVREPASSPSPKRKAAKKKPFVWKPPTHVVAKVQGFLAQAGRPVTAREVCAGTGLDNSAVYRVLRAFARDVGKEDTPGFSPKARLWVNAEAAPVQQETPP